MSESGSLTDAEVLKFCSCLPGRMDERCQAHPEAYDLARDMHNAILEGYRRGYGSQGYNIVSWEDTPGDLKQGLVVGARIYLEGKQAKDGDE